MLSFALVRVFLFVLTFLHRQQLTPAVFPMQNYHHVGTPVVISKDSQMLFEAVKNQSFRSYVLTGLIK